MTHNGISPDEISVLLGQMRAGEKEVSLSQFEMEALAEVLNVSFGSASPGLSNLFSKQVSILAPELSIKHKDEIVNAAGYPSFVLLGQFTGEISGIHFLFINNDIVEIAVQKMDIGSDTADVERQFKAVQEVAGHMFKAVSHSMSAVLDIEISHSLSGMDLIESHEEGFNVEGFTEEEWLVQAEFPLIAGSQEHFNFTLFIPIGTAKKVAEILSDPMDEANMGEEFQSMNQNHSSNQQKDSGPNIQTVQFSSFDESHTQQSEPSNIDLLLDIPLQVTVELGRTKRMVKDILEVSPGSIIELDKLAGEPVDILVNNKLIAVGEVVVIDENFGVRVTDILSTADRISKLR